MRTETNHVAESPELSPRVSQFLEEMTGASMYEFALVASLVAVVGIIVLVALSIGT
jgi:Flp pilus assembly pilin Flp